MPIERAASAPASSEMEMEDIYSEEGGPAEATETEETETVEVEPHTELVSKKLLLGQSVKPGDKVTLTVVKDYGDEVELKYVMEEAEPEERVESTEDSELEELTA
jgi:hypothetical protein